MSRYDYELSQQLSMGDPPFAALIMAAMRKADSSNLILLRQAFPVEFSELHERYHAPGGMLESDPDWVSLDARMEQHRRDIAGRSPE